MFREMFEKIGFAIEYSERGFEALVLKQASKITKGDLGDIKDADIEMVKEMYDGFGAKTTETDIAFDLICETFPN